ncbi:Nn.00g040450.m01.CDS01 [Neocucurbitaria sp. VM-36]
MVWIHGGSFWGGSNVEPTTAPDGLVRQSVENGLPIIHVAMNYRLGFFGFAQSGTLKAEGSENAGLRDQRLAIEWVRDNIEQFGGDPDKITIFGQSSGGLAIGMQLLAYGGTKPLPFQQGITQSQALEPGLTGNFSKDAMSVLVDYVSCNASSLDSPETIHCLRQLDTDTLLNASITTYASDIAHNVGDIWLPAVDGDFLPAPPSQLIAQGRFGNATFMSGWTQDDLNYYTDASIVSAEDTYNFIRGYLPAMPEKSLDELLGIAVHQIYSAPVFPYDFNTTILDSILAATANISGLGVVHTSEFAYVFESLEAYNVSGFPFHPTEADYKLAKRASRSWSTFANQGVPSFSSLGGQQSMTLKGWGEAFKRSGGPNLMTIGGPHEGMSALGGANATLAVQEQKLDKRCAFLNSPEIIEALQY